MKNCLIALALTLAVVRPVQSQSVESLVPATAGTAPNYWCTWYWQNYLIRGGQEVTDPNAQTIYTNAAAREELTEDALFGERGMAVTLLPRTRGDFYFLIDHGWQDKSIEENTFFTSIMDTLDFPSYAHLPPKEQLKQLSADIKALGWRGLGLWFRGSPSREEMERIVRWSSYAGIEYWKIDGGDIDHYYATTIKDDIYPALTVEHITGTGPINPDWDKPGLEYYSSVYTTERNVSQELQAGSTLDRRTKKAEKSLEVIQHTDVFRTYDAAPLTVSATTLQRVHDLLTTTAGKPEYRALLNVQDDCNIAAALGLLVAVKRHPMTTPRMYKGKDFHLQIAGDRHVERRLNEMDRLVRWQRIAKPMAAGYGTYTHADHYLIDSIVFHENDTWMTATHGNMVRQSAPAIMARNMALPEVVSEGLAPYVVAAKFPEGAMAVATEGRVTPDKSWIEPRAAVTLPEVTVGTPIGVFGHYASLTLVFTEGLPQDFRVLAQDLLADTATDITDRVSVANGHLVIPGELIDEIGTTENNVDDISVPGLVVKILSE